MSHSGDNFSTSTRKLQKPHMRPTSTFYRLVAVPVSLAFGLREFFALQRVHWSRRKA